MAHKFRAALGPTGVYLGEAPPDEGNVFLTPPGGPLTPNRWRWTGTEWVPITGMGIGDIPPPTPVGRREEGLGQAPNLGDFMPPAFCFRGDVLVWTPTGPVPIKDLRLGDVVWSWDFWKGTLVRQPIRRITHGIEDHLIHVNEAVHVTRLHRFAVGADQWKRACELVLGDKVCSQPLGASGLLDTLEVTSIRWTPWIDAQEVHNLSVRSHPLAATFYVSGDGERWYLVHKIGRAHV